MNAVTPIEGIRPVADLAAPMAKEEVKAAREALGFKTQRQLADALGLTGKWSKDTVRSWESGRVEISGPSRLALRLMLREKGLLPNADGSQASRSSGRARGKAPAHSDHSLAAGTDSQ
jgi:DNA-binding transcriptional regulator YiaG